MIADLVIFKIGLVCTLSLMLFTSYINKGCIKIRLEFFHIRINALTIDDTRCQMSPVFTHRTFQSDLSFDKLL